MSEGLRFSVCHLAKSLCELEPLVMLPKGGKGGVMRGLGSLSSMLCGDSSSMQQDMTPLFSLAQEGRLDHFISMLQEAVDKNQVSLPGRCPIKRLP